MNPPTIPMDEILEQLNRQSWAASTTLIPRTLGQELLETLVRRDAAGGFHSAAIGQGDRRTVTEGIRGDRIQWLDVSDQSGPMGEYWDIIRALRDQVRQQFFLNLNSYEAHFAVYPANAGYQKHLDQFKGDDGRQLSTILFLNPDWHDRDEGQLVLYDRDDPAREAGRIKPDLGTFACFFSREIWHEVLPPRRERRSLTGWLKSVNRQKDPTAPLF